MWQCEYQSPVLDISLQTIIGLKYKCNSRKVLQKQNKKMEKGFLFFLFKILESHLQSPQVKCLATVHVLYVLAECVCVCVGGGGGLLTVTGVGGRRVLTGE